MSPEQFGAVLFAVGIIGACVLSLWTRWDYVADREVRGHYAAAGVAYDDAELADMVDLEERQVEVARIDDIMALSLAAGVVPAEPTPLFDALVCEEIERAEGWAS